MGSIETLKLYLQENGSCAMIEVPSWIVKDLLRDRLSKSELERIRRFAEKTQLPSQFRAGEALVDSAKKTAQLFQTGINITDLDPTWNVTDEPMTLVNY